MESNNKKEPTIRISYDELQAFMMVPILPTDENYRLDELLAVISKRGIRYGVKQDVLLSIINGRVFGREGAVVAKDRSGTSYSFAWNVPKKTAKRSAGFKVAVGDTINVMALCVPNTVTFRIGIVEPDGVRRYISGTNMLSHIFTVKKAGTHYVYVHNMSTTKDVTINGAYSWN